MSHVYISYSHEDGNFANSLKHEIDQAGFETSLDIDRLLRAEIWQETVDIQIRQSFTLITILSPSASLSACCMYEWAFALGLRIPVIPIILKRTPIHHRLEILQRWDFSNPAIQPVNKLLNQIKQIQTARVPSSGSEIDRGILPALDDLYSENREMRLAALIALGQNPNPLSVPHLLGALGEEDREIRLAIVRALGQIADIRALPRLLYMLRHYPDSQLRAAAAESIGLMDDARVVPGLIMALSDKNETVHQLARQALINKGDDALARLADELQNPNWKIREVAAQTLGEIGGITSLNRLISIVEDPDMDVRIATIRALGDVGEPSAVPILIKSMHSEYNARWRIIAMILLSLKRIGTPEALTAVDEWHKQQKKPEYY